MYQPLTMRQVFFSQNARISSGYTVLLREIDLLSKVTCVVYVLVAKKNKILGTYGILSEQVCIGLCVTPVARMFIINFVLTLVALNLYLWFSEYLVNRQVGGIWAAHFLRRSRRPFGQIWSSSY